MHRSNRRIEPVVKKEIAILVQQAYGSLPMIAERLRDGEPGKDWVASFCKRHKLSFNVPSRQASERYRNTNAEVFTTHLVTLEQVYRELNIDATRLFNLDETGMTPEKDCHGTSRRKAIMPTGVRCHVRCTDFDSNLSRVTLMATISAVGDAVLPLWILKRKRLQYRVRNLPNGATVTDSAPCLLPPDALLTTRP